MAAEDVPVLVMWTLAQIAARDNVSGAAVSKSVKKLLSQRPATPHERGSRDQVVRISLADYDHYRTRYIPAHHGAPFATSDAPSPDSAANRERSFEEARRQNEWMKVEREKVAQYVDNGSLLPRQDVDRSLVKAGTAIKEAISRLPNFADDVALAISSEGIHGVRLALRSISEALCCDTATRLDAVLSVGRE